MSEAMHKVLFQPMGMRIQTKAGTTLRAVLICLERVLW